VKGMKKIIKSVLIIVILLSAFSLFVLTKHINGWRVFTVMSASMEPAVMTGSLVVTQKSNPEKLKKGEIITFIAPTKEKVFVTHRIISTTKNDSLITIKTKGDNNKTADPWSIAGGGVVGKVTYTIPLLGHVLSFIKSKIGILLFILIPSMWIIVDEINNIFALFKERKQKKNNHAEIIAMIVFALTGISFLPSVQPTQAILTDSAILKNNNFTVNTIIEKDHDKKHKHERKDNNKHHDKDKHHDKKNNHDKKKPELQLKLSQDKKYIVFTVDNLQRYKHLSYELTYEHGEPSVEEGITGSENLHHKQNYEKKIDLMTCSTNSCVYHTDASDIHLKVTLTDDKGKTSTLEQFIEGKQSHHHKHK
jgi:signal peptidase I